MFEKFLYIYGFCGLVQLWVLVLAVKSAKTGTPRQQYLFDWLTRSPAKSCVSALIYAAIWPVFLFLFIIKPNYRADI